MKNILSIDIDFLASNYLRGPLSNSMWGEKITEKYWDRYLTSAGVRREALVENRQNIRHIFKVFTKAIQNTKANVVFGIDHDSILNHIPKESKGLNIYNIDHHHDLGYTGLQAESASKYSECNEANWVRVLDKEVDSYTWLYNDTSTFYQGSSLPFKFKYELLEEADSLDEVEWDLVYVCLSPNYTADTHWFYFYLLVDLYENLMGATAIIDSSPYTKPLTEFTLNDSKETKWN